MTWAEPEYTIQEVNAAGKKLVEFSELVATYTHDQFDEYVEAMRIINNWRASHAYPLNTFQVNLRVVARRFSVSPLVA